MNLSSPASSRRVAFAAFAALLALVGFVGTSPASASSAASTTAKGCAKQVVDDWYTHKTKVVGHYPLHCYQEALDSLGSDVNDYTNAKEVISAAAAAEALRCKVNCDTNAGGTIPRKLKPGEKWIEYRNTYDFGGSSETPVEAVPVSSSSPSSVPLPLIVLASLAGVLLLAGAGSYVTRRLKANRAGPPATDTPTP
jgi:hypothetical protein